MIVILLGILFFTLLIAQFRGDFKSNKELRPLWGNYKADLRLLFKRWAKEWNAELIYEEDPKYNYFQYKIEDKDWSFEFNYWPIKGICFQVDLPQLPENFETTFEVKNKFLKSTPTSKNQKKKVFVRTNDKAYLNLLLLDPEIEENIRYLLNLNEHPLKIKIKAQTIELSTEKLWFKAEKFAPFYHFFNLSRQFQQQLIIIEKQQS